MTETVPTQGTVDGTQPAAVAPEQPQPQAVAGKAPEAQPQRVARPIPPSRGKEMADLGFFKNAPDAELEEFVGQAGQRRGPDGRYLPTAAQELEADEKQARADEAADAAAPAGSVKPPSAKPAAAVGATEKPPLPTGEPAATGGKFTLAGKSYETQEQMDNAHRTLQGQFRPLSESKAYNERAAWAWKGESDKRDARIAELERQLLLQPGSRGDEAARAAAGSPGAAAGASGPLNTNDILSKLDFGAFEQIALSDGLPNAGKYLSQQILNAVLEQVVPALRAEQQQALEPFLDERAGAQVAEATEATINQLLGFDLPAGGKAFPELADHAKLEAIGRMWSDAGGNPQDALTPGGMIRAIMFYRGMSGLIPPDAAATSLSTGVGRVDAPPLPTGAPGLAASIAADNRGNAPPNKGRSNLDPATQRLVNALSKVDLVDTNLGFARNKRGAHVGIRGD